MCHGLRGSGGLGMVRPEALDPPIDSFMATDTPDNGRAEAPPVDTDIAEILGLLTRGYVHSAAERAANLLQIRPEHAEAQRLYGVALFRMNQRESAIAALSRAVELAPENAAASWGLAEALQAAGRTAEAERRLEVLLDGRPDDAVGLLMLARLRLEASDPAGALELARRALSVDPQVAGGRALLAALAYGQGDFAAVNETLLPARLSAGRQGAEADPACLLARSLYAAGRNRDLARLPMAQTPAQRHSEAVLLALAAYRENNSNAARRALAQAEAERPAARSAAEAATEGTSGVAMFASLGELLSTLLRQPEEKPELYAGEVAHIVGLIGDSHVLSAGHLVVPWQGHKALLLPEVLLEAAPSALLAEPPEAQTAPLKAALSAAWDRLPKGAIPAVCLGELDLRLTQGLFSRAHALSETELQARLQELAARLAAYVAAEGKVRGTLPILVTPPASNAPLSLLPEDVRLRFAAANRRFVGTLRQAADRLGLPLLDLRAASERGGQAQGQLYIDTNHLWPEAWQRAFAHHLVLPEPAAE